MLIRGRNIHANLTNKVIVLSLAPWSVGLPKKSQRRLLAVLGTNGVLGQMFGHTSREEERRHKRKACLLLFRLQVIAFLFPLLFECRPYELGHLNRRKP